MGAAEALALGLALAVAAHTLAASLPSRVRLGLLALALGAVILVLLRRGGVL